jgi:hypothetical protein
MIGWFSRLKDDELTLINSIGLISEPYASNYRLQAS